MSQNCLYSITQYHHHIPIDPTRGWQRASIRSGHAAGPMWRRQWLRTVVGGGIARDEQGAAHAYEWIHDAA